MIKLLEKLLSKQVLGPIIIILVLWLMYLFINSAIKKLLNSKSNAKEMKRRKTLASLFSNLLKYFLILIGILMILNIYKINTNALVASLGAASLVAGLAFQDILKDLLSGISIILENQYGIGDTVTINGNKGEVIALGIKTTKIRTFNGEVIFLANRNITQVINHSLDFSLVMIDLGLSYTDDIDKIEKVLNNLFKEIKIDYLKGDVKLLGIENFGSSSVIFRITAETVPMKHYEVKRELLKQIKMELDKNNITIPYDQLVIHND